MFEGAQFREHIKQNLAAEVLRGTGRVQLIAFGYSMLPGLWPGDKLTIETRPFEQVRCGDVVLYSRLGRLFIHRVLRVEENQIVTRGDAMLSADVPLGRGELMGVVTTIRRPDGSIRPIPAASRWRRLTGLALAHSGRLRSLALRWHTAHTGAAEVPVPTQQGSAG
jgi:hypothetical protein